jgi:hypothetical protein
VVVREKLIILVMVMLLLPAVQAGEIKLHHWPARYIPQEICEIPVLMDVAFVSCRVIGSRVKLLQVGAGAFEGCSTVLVSCTLDVTLSCSITPRGVVEGTYAASLSQSDIDAPGGNTKLCVTLTDAEPGGQAGRKNVRVATVTITVSTR